MEYDFRWPPSQVLGPPLDGSDILDFHARCEQQATTAFVKAADQLERSINHHSLLTQFPVPHIPSTPPHSMKTTLTQMRGVAVRKVSVLMTALSLKQVDSLWDVLKMGATQQGQPGSSSSASAAILKERLTALPLQLRAEGAAFILCFVEWLKVDAAGPQVGGCLLYSISERAWKLLINAPPGSLAHQNISPCAQCARPGAAFKCSRCGIVRYCNVQCQETNWPTHSAACKIPSSSSTPTST